MPTVRFYLALKWVGWHALRRLPLADRWGFSLGEDLHDWATMRLFMYLLRLEKAAGFEPAQTTRGPRFQITVPGVPTTTTTGTSTVVTWATH